MNSKIIVKKASGELQPLNQQKLEDSLLRAGASDLEVDDVVSGILAWLSSGVTTKMIYQKAFQLLRNQRRSLAARYSLKKALMDLGPTGYPFEHFVGQIFKARGFSVEVGVVVEGCCVQHEMDVIATNGNLQCLVECKFHNGPGKVSNVQTPLYVRSRVDDIVKKRRETPGFSEMKFEGWIFTNTRFTTDAQDYGKCANLHLTSWDLPLGNSLKEIIERERFFPITVLTTLTKGEIQTLLDKGLVLCRQLIQNPETLLSLNLTSAKSKKVAQELEEICGN